MLPYICIGIFIWKTNEFVQGKQSFVWCSTIKFGAVVWFSDFLVQHNVSIRIIAFLRITQKCDRICWHLIKIRDRTSSNRVSLELTKYETIEANSIQIQSNELVRTMEHVSR